MKNYKNAMGQLKAPKKRKVVESIQKLLWYISHHKMTLYFKNSP